MAVTATQTTTQAPGTNGTTPTEKKDDPIQKRAEELVRAMGAYKRFDIIEKAAKAFKQAQIRAAGFTDDKAYNLAKQNAQLALRNAETAL